MKVSELLKKSKASPKVGTLYSEIVLDASGSMRGPKYDTACEGISEELTELRKRNDNMIVRITEFEGAWSEEKQSCMKFNGPAPLDSIKFSPKGTGGATPLYATVGYIIKDLLSKMEKGDAALVKIFTDGGDNSSYGSEYEKPGKLHDLIKEAEQRGVVVTFVGTHFDIDAIIKNIGIHAGNTLSHDNTPASIGRTFKAATRGLTDFSTQYSTLGVDGVAGTSNFYSKIQEDNNK